MTKQLMWRRILKILLTGHKGFIGSHMLTALEKANHEVTTYEWGEGPTTGVIDKDWVIHIGAISSTTERDVDKVMRQNYDFSVDLFNECKTFGVNFQYSSSASVYGLVSDFRETTHVDPKTPYAWSKYMFERYHAAHQGGNIVQGFRYFNVYGPEGEDHKGNQASPHNQFKKQAELNKEIRVFENSEQYQRDFVHVSKIVEAHFKFMNIPESGIWNVGTGQPQSFIDVAKQYKSRITTIPMPDLLKDSYQKYTCADMTKYNATIKKYEN
jgi:ADP-L-glycero-D-manno-heptose 6-epimerase